MSTMQRHGKLDGHEGKIDLSSLPLSRICDCRDHSSRHTKAVADVVSGSLACYQSEERSERRKSATGAWFGELYDGVDMAAQTSSSYGATRS